MAVNFGRSKAHFNTHERMICDGSDNTGYDTDRFFQANRNSFNRRFYQIATGILFIVCITSLSLAIVAILSSGRLKKDYLQEIKMQESRMKNIASAFNETFEDVRRKVNATWTDITYRIAKDIVNKTATDMLPLLVKNEMSKTLKLYGWVRTGNFVFKVFRQLVDYATATRNCQSHGGRLAAEVLRHPDAVRYISSTRDDVRPWIGFDDIQRERRWKWIDGGKTNPNTTAWHPGEPNSAGGNQDCGNIFRTSGGKILLDDDTCSNKLYYICEVKLSA